MGEDTFNLDEAYRRHYSGKIDGNSKDWIRIQGSLYAIAKATVEKRARSLYGPVAEDRIEDVYTALLVKFIDRRLPAEAKIDDLLHVAAGNELMDAFRVSKSITASSGHKSFGESTRDGQSRDSSGSSIEGSWVDRRPTRTEVDDVAIIRERLAPWRFDEFPFAREVVLLHLVANEEYPGRNVLIAMVPSPRSRKVVYSSAVIDINQAILECEAACAH